MMLEDVLEDPRPPWGRALAAGCGSAAIVALLVQVGPDVAEAPEWWGFTTAAVAPTALLAFRVAGGVSWWEAIRGAAVLVLVFGAGLALAAVADATDSAPLYLLAVVVLGLVLSVAFRGRREPVPHVPAASAPPSPGSASFTAPDPGLPLPVEPLPAPPDEGAVALEKEWLDGDEPPTVRTGHQRGWFDEDGEVVTGSTPAVAADGPDPDGPDPDGPDPDGPDPGRPVPDVADPDSSEARA